MSPPPNSTDPHKASLMAPRMLALSSRNKSGWHRTVPWLVLLPTPRGDVSCRGQPWGISGLGGSGVWGHMYSHQVVPDPGCRVPIFTLLRIATLPPNPRGNVSCRGQLTVRCGVSGLPRPVWGLGPDVSTTSHAGSRMPGADSTYVGADVAPSSIHVPSQHHAWPTYHVL